MMIKNVVLSMLTCAFFLQMVVAQDQETLGKMVDDATYRWDAEETELETYEGLLRFCKDVEYRKAKIELLSQIHHLDSVLYERALLASRRSDDREIKRLIHEIEKFEQEYSMKSFIHFLHEECNAVNELEKQQEELETEFASESYDGQTYVIEVELQKYVRHITKRIDHIRKHVHKLHIE